MELDWNSQIGTGQNLLIKLDSVAVNNVFEKLWWSAW